MTPERVKMARLRIERLTDKIDQITKAINQHGPYGDRGRIEELMKARRSSVQARKRWARELLAVGITVEAH